MSAGAGLVMGFYGLLAIPGGAHWAMGETEAKQFVQAWQNVLRHYPISVTQKAFDWAMLVSAMGYMNVPRVYKTIAVRRAKQQPQQQRTAPILRFVQPSAGTQGAPASPVSPGAAGAVTPNLPPEQTILAEGPMDTGTFDGI